MKFSITEEDIIPLPKYCPILNIKLKLKGAVDRCDPAAVTLDRINNKKGYVPGNVVVVSWRANNLKRDATLSELRQIIDFYSNTKAK